MRMCLAAAVVAASVTTVPAAAQQPSDSDSPAGGDSKWGGYGSVGIGLAPEYEGSNSYMLVPYFEGRLNYGNYYARFEGDNLRFNILNDPHFHFGPLIGFRRGRGNVNSPVRAMHHLDDTETVGGFIEWEYVGKDPRYGATINLSGADAVYGEKTGGWKFVGRVTARRPLDFIDRGFIVSASMDLTWISHPYMRTYFGVSPSDAAASGLPVFTPSGGGFSRYGVALSADQFLSRHFSVGVRAWYGRLLGDAASSPVTRDPNQFFTGIVAGYVL